MHIVVIIAHQRGNLYQISEEKNGFDCWFYWWICEFIDISSSGYQLIVVKPKPNQLLTNKTTLPISNHSKTKTKVIP